MRKFLLVLFLAGCVQPMVFDKPGVPPGGGQGDMTDCEVEALAKVPPNNHQTLIGGGPSTSDISCFGNTCNATTYNSSPQIITTDANRGLRMRVLVQCMERKGYTLRK